MTSKLANWQATAFNQSEDSSNQIHSDEMAKTYGFKGGLVPGVTVSAYLIHPAIEAWGTDWLKYGAAKAVVEKPLYDGYDFTVDVTDADETSYQATLTDQAGTRNATGTMRLNRAAAAPPTMRGDVPLVKNQPIANATREEMEKLQALGMKALQVRWNENNNMATYLKNRQTMPDLHNTAGAGYANAAFMLSLSNWVLAGNAYMNPWIHLQTESQNYAIVENHTELHVECDIRDLFEKKGHQFVDLNVDVYALKTAQPVMTTMLRAIYQLRPAV